MKMRLKEREGGKLRRRYDPMKTPFQRLLAAAVLSTADQVRLTAIAQALDPVQLLRQIEQLQDALWKHALTQMPTGSEIAHRDTPTVTSRSTQRRRGE